MKLLRRVKYPVIIIFSALILVVFLESYFIEKQEDRKTVEARLILAARLLRSSNAAIVKKFGANKGAAALSGDYPVDEVMEELFAEISADSGSGFYPNSLREDETIFLLHLDDGKLQTDCRDNKNMQLLLDDINQNAPPLSSAIIGCHTAGGYYSVLLYRIDWNNANNAPVMVYAIKMKNFSHLFISALLDTAFCIIPCLVAVMLSVLVIRAEAGRHFKKVAGVFAGFGRDDFAEQLDEVEIFSFEHSLVFEELKNIGRKVQESFEQAERERKKSLRVLCNIGAALVILDENEKVVLLNSVAENFLGISNENAAGKRLNDVICLLTLNRGKTDCLEEVIRIEKNQPARSSEKFILRHFENDSTVIELGVYPVTGKDGAVLERVIFFWDVTYEYKEQEYLYSANKMLIEKANDMERLLDAVCIATWEVDTLVQKLKGNRKLFDLVHIETADNEITFADLFERLPEKEKFIKNIDRQIHGDSCSITIHVEVRGDDNILRWIFLAGKRNIYNLSNGEKSISGIAIDVTESVIIKRKLEYKELLVSARTRQLKRVYALAKLFFWEYDCKARCITGDENCSRFFMDKTGNRRVFVLSEFFSIICNADRKKIKKRIIRYIRKKKDSGIFEAGVKDLSGDIKYFRHYLNFEYNAVHCIEKIYGVALDITKEKEQEVRLIQASKMESIGKISGEIAHDFKNILGGVMGMADLLRQRITMTDVVSQRYIENIYNTCSGAAEFMKCLLDFSRQDHHKFELLDISKVIDNTVIILKHSIGKNIFINVENDIDDVKVYGDAMLLQNVLLNLGVNARDAIGYDNNGCLTISTSREKLLPNVQEAMIGSFSSLQEYFRIDVADDGIGIEKKIFRKIFDSFFTTKKKGEGTGLGLAAVAETILQHNGAVALKSILGEGTTFSVFLPVSRLKVSEIKSQNSLDDNIKGRILFVGENSAMRIVYEELLVDHDFELDFAGSCASAVKLYTENKDYSGVIIDSAVADFEQVFDDLLQENSNVRMMIIADDLTDSEFKKEKYNLSSIKIVNRYFRHKNFLKCLDALFVK